MESFISDVYKYGLNYDSIVKLFGLLHNDLDNILDYCNDYNLFDYAYVYSIGCDKVKVASVNREVLRLRSIRIFSIPFDYSYYKKSILPRHRDFFENEYNLFDILNIILNKETITFFKHLKTINIKEISLDQDTIKWILQMNNDKHNLGLYFRREHILQNPIEIYKYIYNNHKELFGRIAPVLIYYCALQTNEIIVSQLEEERTKRKLLEQHIKYMPFGEGFQEAKEHFNELANRQLKE